MNSNAGRGFLKAVLIVGFVFAITYFISYNKWASFDFNQVDMSYKTSDQDKTPTNNSVDVSDKYKSLYSKLNYELLEYNFGEEFYDIYYNNKEFYDEYFIYVGIVNLLQNDMILNCNLDTYIKESVLKEEITSIFGNVEYVNKSFNTKNGNVSIIYDSNSNQYNVKLNGKCSGLSTTFNGIKNIYQKSEIDEEFLFIYDKSLYVESIKDSNGNLVFKYHKDINQDSEVVANVFDKIDIETLPTYRIKFIMHDNVFTIDSITRK